ncbi:Non-heme 11 kDa protein of cytochrome bc1 complex [Polychaeton citri CBS 116435]|uniref:Cytochrome b-c1 complex subunit 6, mitochondrial n=1 Tax=Polychaeton citri CBS 116435 TaxID=1314669 RepID=A0A9P4PXY3_9PEZI|nr:Non-heme 11 kDa protein of cytochrome bc1 complex [Polychaeton citri CBS 116435]
MGIFDYISDLYSSLPVTLSTTEAEERQYEGPADTSGEQASAKDQKGGIGAAQHDRGAATRGGASTSTPHSGTNEESGDEAEENKKTSESAASRSGEGERGHRPGDGGAASGQKGADAAGPGGGSVKQTNPGKGLEAASGGDDEAEASGDDAEEGGDDDEEEEEEEEEEEPEDIKPVIEEECLKTAACAPLKHHYDECAERVQQQIDDNGKAEEDCVEEFFHMMHCATQCAAPKLFKQLK